MGSQWYIACVIASKRNLMISYGWSRKLRTSDPQIDFSTSPEPNSTSSERDCFDTIEVETDDLLAAECDEDIMITDCLLNSIRTELIVLSIATHWLLDIKDVLFDLTASCCLVEFLCGQFIPASDSAACFCLCFIEPPSPP